MTSLGASDGAAAVTFLRETSGLRSAGEVARYTVEHVTTATGARWAEVVQADGGSGLKTLAATDRDVTAALQRARATAGEPPLPRAGEPIPTVTIADLHDHAPWPDFAAQVARQTPVRSAVLTYAMAHEVATVLPVYDDRPGYFAAPRAGYVELIGQLAGLVLTRLALTEAMGHLQQAVDSRQRIGTAVGILCARRGLTPDAAFDLLRLTSSRRNRKLRLIAADVVRDGDLY